MKSVVSQAPLEESLNGEIKDISVSDDGTVVEITSDRPIVYTYYMQDSPPGIVIDLAQVTLGNQEFPRELSKGSVRRIDATRHEFGSGVLSRIVVSLSEKVEVSASLDSNNRRHLRLNLDKSGGAPVAEKSEPAKTTDGTTPPLELKAVNLEGGKKIDPAIPEVKEVAGKETSTASEPTAVKIVAPAAEAVVPPSAAPAQKDAKPEQPAGPRSLQAINKSADGIIISLSGEADTFRVFKLTAPERLVLDIAKTKNEIRAVSVELNAFNLGKARIGGSFDKLRVVFDAIGGPIPSYTVSKCEAGICIIFGDAVAKQPAKPVGTAAIPQSTAVTAPLAGSQTALTESQAQPPAISEEGTKAPAEQKMISAPVRGGAGPGIIESLEFKQNDGVSRILLKTAGLCTASEPQKSARGLYISMKDCRLPAKLQRQLDTSGFPSVISEVVPYPIKTKGAPQARIAVRLSQQVPNLVKREGEFIVWEFREPFKSVKVTKPAKAIRQEIPEEKVAANAVKTDSIEREFVEAKPALKPRGDMEDSLTLDKAVQQAAKPGKQYTGRKVSLEFSDADIRKIFQLIAEVSNQNFLISDDVTGTISLKLVNVPWDQALDVILENKGLGMQKDGNIVQIRPKSKMKSLDEEAIQMQLTEEKKMPLSTVIFDVNFATLSDIENQFKTLKSKRADSSISSDARTNKIIVVDVEPNIKKMRALLESLDVPEKQVMIEARIVEASNSFSRDIGVKWNYGYQDGSASVANINSFTSSMGGVVTNVLPSGTTGGIAAGMAFGKLISNIQLDMRLSAAATIGQVKIISTPKVLTVNNKAAKISQGQKIPYQNTTSAEGAKTEFIDASLSLEVTPHITADGSVNMKIKASNNSVGSSAGGTPPINTKEATTELVVKNGETTVIGGIYVDSETDADTGVPYLSDIPLLGWLFKSNSKIKTKNELLIFITPKIVG